MGEPDAVVADGTVLARLRSGRLALVCAVDLVDAGKGGDCPGVPPILLSPPFMTCVPSPASLSLQGVQICSPQEQQRYRMSLLCRLHLSHLAV